MTSTKQVPKRQWPVRLAIIILGLSLFLLPYLTITKNTLTSPENMMTFLEQSKTFDYTAQIMKNEIKTRLPQSVQQNLIERSLIDRLMEIVITPQLIQSIAKPIVKAEVVLLNRDSKNITLKDNKVELNIEPYKQNLTNYIASFNLPGGIQNTVTNFANSVPSSVTLVDGQKNPNSPVIKAIEIKNWYTLVMQVAVLTWWVLALSILALVGLLYNDLHKLFRASAMTFGVLGLLVLMLSYIAPPSLNLFIPNNLTEASGLEISQLIGGVNAHFFALTQSFAWWYLGIAAFCTLVAWYLGAFGLKFSVDDIKTYFNQKLKRFKKQSK